MTIQQSLKRHDEELHSALLHVLHQSMPESRHQVDLIEVCTPHDSPLSKAISRRGGQAQRWGLHNFDLSKNDQFIKAQRELVRIKPRHLWQSPPSTQFSSTPTHEMCHSGTHSYSSRTKEYKKALLIWERCMILANMQIFLGG